MAYETKKEQVADFLREAILSGRFPRGARIKQVEIATMLDISVTPVREALKMLEAEGYLLGSPHRGAVVAPFDLDASEEIVGLRILLESQLVTAAMDRLEKEDFEKFFALHKEFERAVSKGERNTVKALNYRFHRDLYSAANRPRSLRFVKILWAQYPFEMINIIAGRMGRAASEHRAILEGMVAGDRVRALLAVRGHIESGWRELKRSLGSGEAFREEAPEAEPPGVRRPSS